MNQEEQNKNQNDQQIENQGEASSQNVSTPSGNEGIKQENPVEATPTPTPISPVVETTPTANSTPQVVQPQTEEKPKEVPVQNTTTQPSNPTPINDTPVPATQTKIEKPKKKGHPVFLILLIVFLFAFVYFLPQIAQFVSDYRSKQQGDDSMKSGTMTCSIIQSYDNGDNTIEWTFTYQKNKLKKTSTTTSYRLADTATDTLALTDREEKCEKLKETLETAKGMQASCSMTTTVQKTMQDVDYETLDLKYLTENISEFEGYLPEYELNQSIAAIRASLEQSGYHCTAREY